MCFTLCWFQVANGVEALKACAAKLKKQKRDLFAVGDTEYIFLQFGFKKVSLQRQTIKVYAACSSSTFSKSTLLASTNEVHCESKKNKPL